MDNARICVKVEAEDEEGDAVSDDLPKRNPFIRGSDPRVATCRGRLQTRRCQLNQEINKELRLRAGAENLFKATTNRKLRETVALELSFVNSNLQLLKEQLAELNSSVELYQSDSKECLMPLVPLGLKETKEVDFREPFKDFILEHYSENAASYEDAISDFMDMRQAMRTPARSTAGVALLFKYYNQLYFIERRFFPPDRSLGIYFEWFDSLTGVPSCQRTVAFEKACVLFNMAGIYTQIGAKQERHTAAGLDGAVDALLRAAGTLRYIHENFTNAPSVDLAADTLDVLVALMMAQARECLFEKLQLQAREECSNKELELCDDLDFCLDLCQESAQLNHCYTQLYQKMQSEAVFSYVPYSWVSLVHVKTEYYKGLSHHYCATGLLNAAGAGGGAALSPRARDRLRALHAPAHSERDRSRDGTQSNGVNGTDQPDPDDRMGLGRAHLREAFATYEEALRLQRMCRELRNKEPLARVLRVQLEKAAREASVLEEPNDLNDLLDAPSILPSSKFQLSLTPPDFAQHRVDDLFKSLGPVAIFSAKRHWSAPRLVQLQKRPTRRENTRKNEIRNRNNSKTEADYAKNEIRNGHNVEQKYSEGEILRNGLKALRNGLEKRDRSEDNSTYYNQILSDEKYVDGYDVKKRLNNISKHNGVYINSFNNNNYDKYPKIIDAYDYKNSKISTESYVRTSTENSFNRLEAKRTAKYDSNGDMWPKKYDSNDAMWSEKFDSNKGKNGRDRRSNIKQDLRRTASDFNVSNNRDSEDGFGFSVRGDAPVIIAGVEPNSLADIGGMREGDFIVSIGDKDVKWSSHEEVVRLIQRAGDTLTLRLVTPMDRNYLKSSPTETTRQPNSNQGSVSAASTASSGSTGAVSSVARRAPSWNPFRRHTTRDNSSHRGSHTNVIFR